jgi:hypothetical protein
MFSHPMGGLLQVPYLEGPSHSLYVREMGLAVEMAWEAERAWEIDLAWEAERALAFFLASLFILIVRITKHTDH